MNKLGTLPSGLLGLTCTSLMAYVNINVANCAECMIGLLGRVKAWILQFVFGQVLLGHVAYSFFGGGALPVFLRVRR